MTSCTEYVSLGHPDKTADAIASCLLDEYLKNDPKVRFALEVQLKDHICNLAGEVTSTWKPSDDVIAELVREAIRKVGYTAEYAAKWPEGATLNADKVVVNNYIGRQSPDIAQGVDREGWGDQGCLKKGTLVKTTRGLVRIEEVKVGDKVIVDGQKYQVHNSGKTGELDTIILRTNRGRSLCLTPDHRVYSEGRWIEAKDMLNHRLAISKDNIFGQEEFAVSMTPSAKYHGGKCNGRGKNLNLDENLAYLIGFLTGDGAITQDNVFTFACKLLDKREAVIPKIKKIFRDAAATECNQGIVVYGELYRKALGELGVEKSKAINKRVPFSILQSPKQIQCAYLRGLFDADGTVILCKGGHGTQCCRIRLGSISRELIDNVFCMLKNMGINASIVLGSGIDPNKKIPQLNECWVVEIRGLRSKRQFMTDIGFDVEYKSKRLEDYIKIANSHREDLNEIEYVKEIIPGKIEEVYDIGIEDVHCFYANGILVHNCFAGMATNEERYNYFPCDVYFAREIGKRLYRAAKAGTAPIGLDIKTLVSTTDALNVEQVIVAAPMLPENEQEARSFIEKTVKEVLDERHHICNEIIINGTGAYVVHSSVGDAGVVGRKLAVDFYGLNCPIGGGATFGKDGTKADVTLNLYARYRSLKTILVRSGVFDKVYTKIGCCIGKSQCLLSQEGQDHEVFNQETIDIKPSEYIHKFGLDGSVRDDMFFHLCEDGLFSYVDELAVSELR